MFATDLLTQKNQTHFMKKVFLAAAFVVAGFIGANAQKGNNQIGVGVDLGLPMGDFGDAYKLGIGGYVKGLFGIGSAGQISLTTGYTSFSAKDEFKDALGADKIKGSVIPIMVGYRHNFTGFYVEPQVGYGIYGTKIEGGIFEMDDSEGAFTYALGLGYSVNGFDIGARYESASKDGDSQSMIGFRIGYNFTLGGGTAKK